MPNQDTQDKASCVKSVLKAFLIMEELDKSGELSISDLSERLHMDKATIHRLSNTMKSAGYVNQNAENKKYSNSLKLFAMGNRAMEKTGVKHISRPFVEELAEKTNETVNLGVPLGNEILYMDKLESSSTIKVGLGIGTSVPSYCSGLGKAILAFTPTQELNEMIDSITFEKFTERTITEKNALLKEFQKIREIGYAVDDEEYVIGLVCIAAPIFNYHGDPVASISVSSPKYRYIETVHLKMYSSLVVEAARKISGELGYKSV